MGYVILKYSGSTEHRWQEGDVVNPASSSGVLSMTTVDLELINLRQFDTEQEAAEAREALVLQIEEGLLVAEGNGDVIVTIDDL